MEVFTLVAFWFVGFFCGAAFVVGFTVEISKRALRRKKAAIEEKTKKVESVGDRMKKVKEITNEQLELQGQISGPQKNALHGKYKNGLIGRLKELDTQKMDILKSIIADGFDPEITVMDEIGVVTTIKLSEFLTHTGITMPPKGPPPPRPSPTKQFGKFTVHKGGKDDGGNTTH